MQRAQLLLCWCISCSVGAFLALLVHSCSVGATLARLVHLRQVHPLSVPPFAFAVRSDSVRRPIGFRPPSVEKCWEKRCKNVVLNGNTIGDFAIFDVSVFRCFYYPHPNNLCRSVKSVGGSLFAWLVHLRQVHPLKLHLKSVGEYSAVNSVSSAYSVGDHSVKPSMKSCFFVQFRRLLEKNAI